jgi:acyl-CoA reductase-like NAD-dependent aldehyde dehydrogenase
MMCRLKTTDRVLQEEIFGPVVTIVPFKTEEEVSQSRTIIKKHGALASNSYFCTTGYQLCE